MDFHAANRHWAGHTKEVKMALQGALSKLAPKSVFITGANRGIGLEFVRQLLQLPSPPKAIFATCRNPDNAQVRCCYSIIARIGKDLKKGKKNYV